MKYYIVAFRSRTETINFANIMLSYGAKVNIINTPRQATVSCGISVRVGIDKINLAKEILSRRKFATFAGIFLIDENLNSFSLKPI